MTGKPKIPQAREILEEILSFHKIDIETRIKIREALGLMYRKNIGKGKPLLKVEK